MIKAVLDEDLICRTFPLSVKPADVRIAPAEEFLKKPDFRRITEILKDAGGVRPNMILILVIGRWP